MSTEAMQVKDASGRYLAKAEVHDVPPGYKRTEVGVIPEDWAVTRLGSLFDITSSKRVFQSEWRSEGVPFYRARELAVLAEKGQVENDLFITQKMYDAYKVAYGVPKAGDLLITGVGTLGKVYVISDDREFYFKDGNIIWLRNSGRIHPGFLRQLYLTPLIIKQIDEGSAGTTVGTYTIAGAKKTTIPLPPLPEQRAIAETLSDVEDLLGALEALIAKKRAIKQTAMQQLLSGKTRLPGFSGEWETKRLGEIASIRNQKVMPSNVNPDTPCVELEHIGQGDGRLVEHSTARNSTSSKYRFCAGDVLFGRLRSYLQKYWLADCNGICTTEIWPLMVDPGQADSGFLLGIVQSDRFIESASISYGTHMPRADWGVMRNFEVRLPKVNEQTAIATVLSDMDAGIAALERRRDKTRALKQGMMQQLLTGRVRLVEPAAMETRA